MKKLFLSLLLISGNLFADTVLFSDNQLIIPSVSVGDKMYAARLDLVANSNPLQFQLLNPVYGEVLASSVSADFSNNTLTINYVKVGNDLYSASLQLTADNPLTFDLQQAEVLCQDCAQGIDNSPYLYTTAFVDQDRIPVNYSCVGASVSPALTWTPGPAETVSYVVLMDDPDAVPVAGFTWVHMNLYNIPANTYTLAEGLNDTNLPSGAGFGPNDNGNSAYDGPCPPSGQGEHTYNWRVYALNTTTVIPSAPMTREEFEQSYASHILASSLILQGRFER